MNEDRSILTTVFRWLLCHNPWPVFFVVALLYTPVSAVAEGRLVQSLDGDGAILFDAENEGRDNRDMAVREIQLAKEAGFNMIRPWRRPPAPMWLDLADEMGVLVVGSPVLECMRLP